MLAICVGMQALLQYSEENHGVDCIGLIPGKVVHFADHARAADGTTLKVPHMGWNHVRQSRAHPMWRNIADNERFYFVHSYSAPVSPLTIATATYGEQFSALVQSGNVFGAQFHPERSARIGSLLLRNFLQLQQTQ